MATRDTTDRGGAPGRSPALRVRRSIPADVSLITPVVEEVMAKVGGMGLAAGKEFEVETALREALANAIRHGCRHDRSKRVWFVLEGDPTGGVRIVVRDPGAGFDPAAVPSPLMGEEMRRSHGRGLYLLSTLMDDVRFERGGTKVVMRKR